jgi:hypothetical protein
MEITAIDSRKDLFEVKDVLSNETMDKLSKVELEDISWKRVDWQEDIERRQLDVAPGSIFEQIVEEINSQRETISKAIGRNIKNITANFWLDMPGFNFPLHIDNPGVVVALQLYLKDCDNAGTRFYTPKDSEIEIRDDEQHWHYMPEDIIYSGTKATDYRALYGPVRHTFSCVKNTGYIMLNGYNQLHGVPITLGKDDLRLSAYCFCEE